MSDGLDCDDLLTLIAQTDLMTALMQGGVVRLDPVAYAGQMILRAKLQRVLDAMQRGN